MLARHLRGQGLEHVQRQLQPVHFLRVDGQADVGAGRAVAQCPDARHQLGQYPLALRLFIARVQRAELDRDPVVVLDQALRRGAAGDGLDAVLVTGQVAQRIRVGARAFAQHVVGKPEAARLRRPAAWIGVGRAAAGRVGLAHRLVDVLTQDELPSQQLHGAQGCGHHGARAQLAQQPRLLLMRQQLLGQRDGALRQPGQCAVGILVEVGPAQLVGGEFDRGVRVGHPQQRLGQPHQGQSLGAADRVLLEQPLHRPERRRSAAHCLNPGGSDRGGCGPVEGGVQGFQLAPDDVGFGSVGKGQALGGGHDGKRRVSNEPMVARFLVNFRLNYAQLTEQITTNG